MKANIREWEGCFAVEIQAQTKDEVILFARMGIMAQKELRARTIIFPAASNGDPEISIVFGKKKKANAYI